MCEAVRQQLPGELRGMSLVPVTRVLFKALEINTESYK